MTFIKFKDALLWMPTNWRPVTATLYVNKNWDDSDGSSWEKAYNTINSALDAASTDAEDNTLILIWAGTYNIDVTGDPTWSANLELQWIHRRRSIITNSHASATSIIKFTWQASIRDLAFPQTWTCNWVIFTQSAFRVRNCWFNSSACTGAVKWIELDWSWWALIWWLIEDIRIIWNVSYTTWLYLNKVMFSDFKIIDTHFCINWIQIVDIDSDNNFFNNIDIWGCTIWLNIDAWNSQHFNDVFFHENTLNIDDEVGDHHRQNIQGEFPIMIYPEDLTWVEVACGDLDWGSDIELRAAVTATKPFKVVSYTLQPSNEENTLIRFSADSGSTFFAKTIFSSKKNKASWSWDTTDFIFNVWSRISASAWSPSSWRTIDVRLDIQEL